MRPVGYHEDIARDVLVRRTIKLGLVFVFME